MGLVGCGNDKMLVMLSKSIRMIDIEHQKGEELKKFTFP